MKKFILALFLSCHSIAFATVDSNTNVFILAKHVQTEEYFVQLAPIIGCYGVSRGPQLQQLTRDYMVNNIGCGTVTSENINELTCATVRDSIEADDFSTFKKITLDISRCADKNSRDFIRMVKKVVQLNFATKTVRRPELVLIK